MNSEQTTVAFAVLNAFVDLIALGAVAMLNIALLAKIGLGIVAAACAVVWIVIGYYTLTEQP